MSPVYRLIYPPAKFHLHKTRALRHTYYSMEKFLIIVAVIVGGLLTLAALAAAILYLWPLQNSALQTAKTETFSYDEVVQKIDAINKAERDEGVSDDCQSKLYSHGKKTDKSVVMLHGVTACPKEFGVLAEKFYQNGYNVYIPRVPHHGLANNREHGKVTAEELVSYTNDAVNIVAALGNETGAVGLSGGALLATWAAEYRSEIQHALLLSPFYEPAISQAPKWQLKPLYVLYGKHILPDMFTVPGNPEDAAFSYAGLANYGIVYSNLKADAKAPGLKTLGLVTSEKDDQVDLDLAKKIPEDIAKANNLTLRQKVLPASLGVRHDIVGLDEDGVTENKDYLYNLYFSFYEDRDY